MRKPAVVAAGLAVVVVFAAMACAAAVDDPWKCHEDRQCRRERDGKIVDEHCLFGQCQECAADSHCPPAASKCSKGRCRPLCATDDDCDAADFCDAWMATAATAAASTARGTCETRQCDDARPCRGASACIHGRCEKPRE